MLIQLIFGGVIIYISYRKIVLGIMFLLIASCTFNFISEFTSIQLGGNGSFSISDVLILLIFLKTIQKIKINKKDYIYILCLFMVFWICFSAILAFMVNQIGLREVYRSIFKIALFWILPITVRELDNGSKDKLVTFSLYMVGIISIILLYAVIKKDVDLLAYFYPTQATDMYGYGNMSQYYLDIYKRDETPRLYISGNVFIKMTFGFVFCLIVFNCKEYNKYFLIFVLIASGLFTLSLGGRSDFLFILCSILTVIIIAIYKKKSALTIKILIFILALTVITFMFFSVTKIPYFEFIFNKWNVFFAESLQSTQSVRLEDSAEAWDVLLQSPLWGIGVTKVHWEATNIDFGGQDIHPFLAQGLLGGFPAIIILFCFYYHLYCSFKCRILTIYLNGSSSLYVMAAIPALVGAVMLSFINTTATFLYASTQVPWGIFSGFLLTKLATKK